MDRLEIFNVCFFSRIVGCGSASLKLCVCDAASPWSQSPSPDSQCGGEFMKIAVTWMAVLKKKRKEIFLLIKLRIFSFFWGVSKYGFHLTLYPVYQIQVFVHY